MSKIKLNYLIDLLAALSFLITSFSGVIILIFMPSGVRKGRYQEFLEIQKGTWSEIHNWAGMLMIILVIIHLILHWKWVKCVTKNFFKEESYKNKKDRCENSVDKNK